MPAPGSPGFTGNAAPAWQQTLDETLAALRTALGDNLHSVVLYGSAARGDFVAGVSDLNLLIVLNDSTPRAHEALATALRGRANVEPFAIGRPGLVRTARAFPAKFAAIRRTGRVVHGPDPLAGVPHFPDLERFAAEQALRNVRLRLVYNFIKRGADQKMYARFVIDFAPAVYAACNAALELEGHTIPKHRDEQARLYASVFGADSSVLGDVIAIKKSRRPISAADVSSIHERLFTLVMAALDWAEKRWPV